MNALISAHLEKIESRIRDFLPLEAEKGWRDMTFGTEYEAVCARHAKPLLETTRSLVDLGGKRWRPLLLVLCSQAASGGSGAVLEDAYNLAPLVEFVHTASLIHDDIEDSSTERRGKPAAHITYGMDTAVNAGSWLYFHGATCIEKIDRPAEFKARLFSTYASELRRLHLGQAMDIAWHRSREIPARDEYLAMVKNKTGTLASLAAKVGTMCAVSDGEKIARAGNAAAEIGAGFQIIDDVVNLTSGNPGKKRGDDIVEGKKSLPVILFAQEAGEEKKLELARCMETAAEQGIESPRVEEAISLLAESGSIQRAKKIGIEFINSGAENFLELFGAENSWAHEIGGLFKSMIPAGIQEEQNA